MSPELVDQAVLAQCQPQLLKVARIIFKVATDFKVPNPIEAVMVDDVKTAEELKGTGLAFIADRIKALVKAGRLESAGNLDRWAYSEIRLTGK